MWDELCEFYKKNETVILAVVVVLLVIVLFRREGMVVGQVFSSGASQRFAGEQTATNQGPPASRWTLQEEAAYLEKLRRESQALLGSEGFKSHEHGPGLKGVAQDHIVDDADVLDEDIKRSLETNALLDPQGHSAYEVVLQNQLYR